MSDPTCLSRLVVCTGKDCRRDKGFDELMRLAEHTPGSLEAPCQGLCHGPIVAVRNGDEVRWFEKVRSKSMRKRLAEMASTGRAPKRLREREVTKRHNIVRGGRRVKPLGA